MSNPRTIFKDISDVMGSAPSSEMVTTNQDGEEQPQSLSVSTYEPRQAPRADLAVKSSPIEEQDLLDDFTFSRKSQQMIIESAGTALQEAISAAIASGNPEGFSAVASLMAQINAANKNLLEIHRTATKANMERKAPQEKKSETSNPETPKTGGDIFMTGTTAEMISLLKKLGKMPNEPVG